MPYRVIYPGTFDPPTLGHIDLIKRASRMFDETIVAVAANPQKAPLFDLDERVSLVEHCIRDIPTTRVIGFSGLLIKLLEEQDARVILRGLRAVSDFEFEFQLASMNRRLNRNCETIFLTPSEKHFFVSASLVKEIARLDGEVGEFLHPYVHARLKAKYEQES